MNTVMQMSWPEASQEAEELFSYHAVIVDDLKADFPRHLNRRCEEFVSRRGGGFLMLGALSPSEGMSHACRRMLGYLHPREKGPAEYR